MNEKGFFSFPSFSDDPVSMLCPKSGTSRGQFFLMILFRLFFVPFRGFLTFSFLFSSHPTSSSPSLGWKKAILGWGSFLNGYLFSPSKGFSHGGHVFPLFRHMPYKNLFPFLIFWTFISLACSQIVLFKRFREVKRIPRLPSGPMVLRVLFFAPLPDDVPLPFSPLSPSESQWME